MKLELEVLASTSIKRKKPWPRMTFLGEIQESLFLLDKNRVSTLYIPSGKTKRKIPKLHPLLSDVVCMSPSENGVFIGGILRGGDAFIWHKDRDMLKMIPGVPGLVGKLPLPDNASAKNCASHHLVVSGNGCKMLVVVEMRDIYVWERDANLVWPKSSSVEGHWSRIVPDHSTPLPSSECRESSVSAVFYIRQGTLGQYGLCSFVFNDGDNICITTVVLKWFDTQDIYSYRSPVYTAEWSHVRHQLSTISDQAMPIRAPGAYVSSYSKDGSLLAVAMNQFDSFQNRVIYLSPWTDSTLVVDVKGAGSKTPITRHARWYWIADMQWTNDDLFVVCVTKQGALGILSRLGEPLLIQTHGNSIEMGPKMFLPLHPLIVVQAAADEFAESQSSKDSGYCDDENDPMRQRFSVTTHPTQPIILCSDGYMVTVLAMPSHTTCLSIMRGLVTESNRHLRLIRDQQKFQMTMFETLKKKRKLKQNGNVKFGKAEKRIGLLKGYDYSSELPNVYQAYKFESVPDDSLNKTQESDLEDVDPAGQGVMANIDFNMGKIMFGDVENMNGTLDYRHLFSEEGTTLSEQIYRSQKGLTLAWGMATTHTGRWTLDHEEVANHITHDLVKLFSVILHSSPAVQNELDVLFGRTITKSKKAKRIRPIMRVFSMFQMIIRMSNFDAIHRHLMVNVLSFVHSTVDTMLKWKPEAPENSKTISLHGCYVVMKLCEFLLKKTYSSPQRVTHVNGLPYAGVGHFPDILDPAILSDITYQRKENQHVPFAHLDHETSDDVSQVSQDSMYSRRSEAVVPGTLCDMDVGKRLCTTWKALYKNAAGYYKYLHTTLAVAAKRTKATKLQELELQKVTTLLVVLQWKLETLGVKYQGVSRNHVSGGTKLSINGSSALATYSWMNGIEKSSGDTTFNGSHGRLLHAILYTHMMQDDLRAALDLVELLIRQEDIRKAVSVAKQSEESRRAILSLLLKLPNETKILPPKLLNNRASRHAVQSLARVMTAYFTNRTLFVFPPHAPRRIPPLHTEYSIEHRIFPLYHDNLAASIREKCLGEAWTPERTLEYLLVGGLLPEAVWFVHSLGDWKAAFLMSVALVEHERDTPDLYERKKKLYLPTELHPQNIIQEQLEIIFKADDSRDHQESLIVDESTDFDNLSKTLSDLLLAATICRVDIVPWLLEQLSSSLKSLASEFSPLVPDDLYLPAPPVYCPQPAADSEYGVPADVLHELRLRRKVSSVILLLQLVLNGSKTTIPSACWYCQKLLEAFAKGLKFKRGHQNTQEVELDIQVLQDAYLGVVSSFQGLEVNPSVNTVLSAFRDMCSVTWMMYSRDKLSLQLRKKATLAEKRLSKAEKVSEMQWLAHCKRTLEWALHMIPFSHMLDGGDQVFYGAILSLLIELPANEASGKILAEYFYEAETLHPDIQDRLQWLLKEWQRVFLDDHGGINRVDSSNSETGSMESPRGLTLSFYYQKYVKKVEKLMSRRRRTFGKYDEFTFSPYAPARDASDAEDDDITLIGSRPFESSEEYLQFIDEFYAISFHQIMDTEKENKGILDTPLLLEYSDTIRNQEMNSLTHRAVTSLQKKQGGLNVVAMTSPRGVPSPRGHPSPFKVKIKKLSSAPPKSPTRKGGLFRSRSVTDVSKAITRKESATPKKEESSNSWLGGTLQSELQTTKAHISTDDSKAPRQLPKTPTYLSSIENKLERSLSVSDLQKQLAPDPVDAHLIDSIDPLTAPVVPEWLLDNMAFEPKWNGTEQLLQWLFRWSNRNHTLVDRKHYPQNSPRATDFGASQVKMSSAMKIRVPPRMMMYSLWLLENVYYPDPSYAAQAQIPRAPVEVTVAVASRGHPESGGGAHTSAHARRSATPDTGRSDLTNISDFSEDISVSTIDVPPHRPHTSKKDKKKKKDKKRDKRAAAENMPVEPEVRTNVIIERKVTKKLSFKLPEPDVESRQSSARSDSTINVSSLEEDNIVADVVRRHLEMSTGSADGPTTPSSMEGTMLSTVRFVPPPDTPPPSVQPALAPVPEMPAAAAAATTDSEIGHHLQSIVRGEMKRLMMAQQQGMIAMLGALDHPPGAPPVAPVPMAAKVNNDVVDARQEANRRRECVVMTVQADVPPDLKSNSTDVSPLNSDDLFSDASKSTSRKPLTLDDLQKDTNARVMGQRNGQPLHGALQQLRLMENQYVPPPGQQGAQPARFSGREEDKENITQPLGYPLQYGAPAGQSAEPFSRLMGVLRQVNQDLGALTGARPSDPVSLLRQPQPQSASVFPPLVTQAWPESGPPPPPGQQQYRMPHLAGQPHEPPERDVTAPLPQASHARSENHAAPAAFNGFQQMPLLKLPDQTKFDNLEQNRGVQLIPPQQILDYERSKYSSETGAKRQLEDYLAKEMHRHQNKGSAVRPNRSFQPGERLLKVDMEPFGPGDERDNESRRRRRAREEAAESPRRSARGRAPAPHARDHQTSLRIDEDLEEDSLEGSLADTVIRVSSRKGSPRKDSSRKSSPRKTPRSGRREKDDEGERINLGYAITPGMFDEYLDQDREHGTALDNHARIQYQAATGTQARKHVLKKDVACDTEGDLVMIDAATAIAREQGTDPVTEALQKYYRAKTGHSAGILPPDIFLGLRFNDSNKEQTSASPEGPAGPSGRAYLSVVDIGGDMLDDIPSTVPGESRRKPKQQDSPRRPKRAGARVEFQEPEKEEDAMEHPGPDRVTVNLLGDARVDGFRVSQEGDLARHPIERKKESIRQRLGDMNGQFNAIAAMANNIEADLRSTRTLMRTIEQIGEAVHPTPGRDSPPDDVPAGEMEDEPEDESDIFRDRHNLKPSEVRRYRKQDRRSDVPTRDGRHRTGASLERTGDEDRMNDTVPNLEMSGLSGVSDIVGEVLATGDVDIRQLGFTQKESDELVERAIKSARETGRLSNEDLQKIFQESRKQKRDDKQKKELQEWMQKKKGVKSKEWRKQQDELRGTERNPYTSPAKEGEEGLKGTGTWKDIMEGETVRQGQRQKAAQNHIEARKKQASQLMGNILADQASLPKPEPVWAWDEVPVGGKKRDTSPAARTGARARTPGRTTRKTGSAPRARFVSPSPVRGEKGYDEDRLRVSPGRYLAARDSRERGVPPRASGSGRIDEFTGTMRTSDGLKAYTKHLENMETGEWQDATPRAGSAPVPTPRGRAHPRATEQEPVPAERPYKPKPFTKMVRLQRPEATRARQNRPKATPYVDRLGQLSNAGSTARSGDSRREQEKLYGSKRLPGAYKRQERTAPRVVKTYQQRLADMKSSGPPSQPLRRTYVAARRSQEMMPATPPQTTKPRRTKTYAEQLQQLQPPKELYRSGEGTLRGSATFKPSHGPAHKAKTYVQQLQELQRPVPPRQHAARTRGRPYGDPYRDTRPGDDDSAVSPWSLDHDLHNIIYDGEESSFHPSVAATDFDISELTELEYMPDEYGYTDMVGIEDIEGIADAGSVSDGSIMSFIDWDAVENLIADVH